MANIRETFTLEQVKSVRIHFFLINTTLSTWEFETKRFLLDAVLDPSSSPSPLKIILNNLMIVTHIEKYRMREKEKTRLVFYRSLGMIHIGPHPHKAWTGEGRKRGS